MVILQKISRWKLFYFHCLASKSINTSYLHGRQGNSHFDLWSFKWELSMVTPSYVPPWGVGGNILLLVRILSASVLILSALYLLNQWVDFDQTCINTLFGWGKDVIIFWWPWPHFQGHTWSTKFHRRRLHSWLSALCLLNQWVDFDQTGTDTLLGWGKEMIRFGWLWTHFQGHSSTLKFSNFVQKSLRILAKLPVL